MKLFEEYPWLTEHKIKIMFIALGSDIDMLDTLNVFEEDGETFFSFQHSNDETSGFSFKNNQFKNMLKDYRKLKLKKINGTNILESK